MSVAGPLISFLVVVRNERAHIEGCLESMLNQTLDPALYEIIVVDSMSTDGTRQIIARWISAHSDRAIRYFDNPGLTLSCGWNIGIKEARTRYVVRIDAHAEVPPDFLARSLAAKQAHPEAVAVGGVLETAGVGFWGQIIAALRSSRIGTGGSRFRVGSKPGPAFTIVYALYERSALLEIGGFDEGLPRNQDIVCHGRLRVAGKILHFDPTIRSTFHPRSTLPALWWQQYRNSKWVILMLKHQHKGSFRPQYAAPLVALLIMVYLLVDGVHWYDLMWIGLYVLAGLATAVQHRLRPLQVLGFPVAMVVLHTAYALGSIVGLLELPFYRPNPARMHPLRALADRGVAEAPAPA